MITIDTQHIVQTICFQAEAATEETANVFTDKVRTIDCEALLSKALRNYDTIIYRVKIDSLTLDLGNIDLDDLNAIEEKILKQLQELFSGRFANGNFLKKNNFFENDDTIKIETAVIETQLEIFIYYLLNGALPWNVTHRLDIKNLALEILQSNPLRLKQALLPALKKELVAERLFMLLQFDALMLFCYDIAETGSPVILKKITDAIKAPDSVLPDVAFHLSDVVFQKQLAVIVFKALYESYAEDKDFDTAFISLLQPLLYKFSPHHLKIFKTYIEKLFAASTHIKEKIVFNKLLELYEDVTRQQSSHASAFINEIEQEVLENNLLAKKENVIHDAQIRHDEETANTEKQLCFINNAGLVLLNSALMQKYFEQAGWVKERKIVSRTAQQKMVLWMNVLIWGERKLHEYDLLLNKVLAGMQPDDICDINILLSDTETAMADHFLETIIMHWNILKNTSPHGFRNSFLQRKGRLSSEDGAWQLYVESKGYDILIDSLPWSFSIIKFPWMTKPLFTQWQTRI